MLKFKRKFRRLKVNVIQLHVFLHEVNDRQRRSQWPRDLRRGSAAHRLLGLRVRIPPESWMSVCRECCVLSSRGLCEELITRPEESYRVWWVWMWAWILDNEGILPQWGLLRHCKKNERQRNYLLMYCLVIIVTAKQVLASQYWAISVCWLLRTA